jgi:Lon protease-like protein
MDELALFPLNTVLFPGMPLQLHIFEERYKLMINQCVQEDRPFGVVLIREGLEALGPLAKPFGVGCTARVVNVSPLTDGQMNIDTVGEERFKILQVTDGKPYLTAQIEAFPLDENNVAEIMQAADELRPWLIRYLEILAGMGDLEVDFDQIPQNPVDLAYTSAFILQTNSSTKQTLLEAYNAVNMLSSLQNLYRRETALLKAMQTQPESPDNAIPFSLN